jgi:hypothetical protein
MNLAIGGHRAAKIEFIINFKTARVPGIIIPPLLLGHSDTAIE